MARKNDDTWDLASGVGATATAVAASRALANRAGLIDDTWAEPLVRAVGMEHFVTLLDHGTPADGSDGDLSPSVECTTETGICENPPVDCSDGDLCTTDECNTETGN